MAGPKGPYRGNFGGGGNGSGDDDLSELGHRLGDFLRSRLPVLVLLVAGVLAAYTSYYQVEPEEVALVTRFGRYVYTSEPGPHFKWPFGIERAIKVPVQRQLKDGFGFRTAHPDVGGEYTSDEETARESRMLTGDLNVADVEWIVQYKVRDPYEFVFRVRDVRGTLRAVTEAMMRKVVGDHSVTEVLTVGREQVQALAKEELQKVCNHYQMGIEIQQLVLQDVNPPEAVRESFNEVNQAIQERERSVNQAWARYNTVIPEAQGKAQQQIEGAKGYAAERVNNARGDVQRFLALEAEYKKAPAVTRTRLYLEAMSQVLPKTRRRIFIDEEVKGLLPLFSLSEGSKP